MNAESLGVIPEHIASRGQWTMQRIQWRQRQQQEVIFTDERRVRMFLLMTSPRFDKNPARSATSPRFNENPARSATSGTFLQTYFVCASVIGGLICCCFLIINKCRNFVVAYIIGFYARSTDRIEQNCFPQIYYRPATDTSP